MSKSSYSVTTAAAKRIALEIINPGGETPTYAELLDLLRDESIYGPENKVAELLQQFHDLGYDGLVTSLSRVIARELRATRDVIRHAQNGQEAIKEYQL
jgi:hypothetical protein